MSINNNSPIANNINTHNLNLERYENNCDLYAQQFSKDELESSFSNDNNNIIYNQITTKQKETKKNKHLSNEEGKRNILTLKDNFQLVKSNKSNSKRRRSSVIQSSSNNIKNINNNLNSKLNTKRINSYDKQLSINSNIDNILQNSKEEETPRNLRQYLDKKFTFTKRKYFDALISIMSLVSFLTYLTLTYVQNYFYIHDYLDYIFCSCYLIEYTIYLLLAQHKFQHIMSFRSILELLIISPLFLASFQERKETYSISSSSLTSFINITRVFRITRIFQIFYIIKTEESDIAKQIFMIISTIIMILFISSGILQIIENEEVLNSLNSSYDIFVIDSLNMRTQFHHYIYFCIISISTVGYGDITPITYMGKFLVVFLVLITIALIPKQTNELIQLIGAQSDYARNRYKSSTDIKHIIITGDVAIDSLKSFCLELFHPDHGSQYKHAIIINPKIPSREMESLIFQKQYENFIHWLEGDPMNEKDLNRSDISKAKACVIFNNKNAVDPHSSDHKNILLALYIKKYVYNYNNSNNANNIQDSNNYINNTCYIPTSGYCNFRLFLQLIKPENKYHYYNSLQKIYKDRMPADNLIIIEEIKMNLIAKSCLTPGIMAMIANLVMSSSSLPNNDCDWLKEYSEGRGHEIYRISLPESYKYMTFLEIAKEVYSREHAIAFAIEIETHKTSIIKLNPGNISIENIFLNHKEIGNTTTVQNLNNLKFNLSSAKIHLYIICLDKQIAESACGINFTNNSEVFGNYSNHIKKANNYEIYNTKNTNYVNNIDTNNKELNNLVSQAKIANNENLYNKFNNTNNNITVGINNNNNKNNVKEGGVKIAQKLSNLYASYNYGINYNYDSISENSDLSDDDFINKKTGTTYEDYEIDLDNYFTMKNFDVLTFYPNVDIMQHTIKDSKDINSHILVCGIHPNMFHFILPLRAKYLGNTNLKYIVILGENLSESLYNDIAKFPYIIYVQGSPLLPENLYRANIMNAEIAVILSNSNIKSDNEESNNNQTLDAETIFIYKAIKKCNKNIQIMTELVSANNIEYLLNKTSSDNEINDLYEYSPLFASGEVFTPSIIDRITCQIYYNPNLLTILEQVLNGGATNKNKKVLKIEKELDIPSSNVYLLQMPEAFIGEVFERLFNHLIDSNYVIPLGLYRKSINDDFYFVYTNPSKTTILRSSDLLFVLGQTSNIFDLLEDKDNSTVMDDKLAANKNVNINTNKDKNSDTSSESDSDSSSNKSESNTNKISESTNLLSINKNLTQLPQRNSNDRKLTNLNKKISSIKLFNFNNKELKDNKKLVNRQVTLARRIPISQNNVVNDNKELMNESNNEKTTAKFAEVDNIRDKLLKVKNKIIKIQSKYENFNLTVSEAIDNEIEGELRVYLNNK